MGFIEVFFTLQKANELKSKLVRRLPVEENHTSLENFLHLSEIVCLKIISSTATDARIVNLNEKIVIGHHVMQSIIFI